MAARQRGLALQHARRDARDQERGDDERDAVDPVRRVRTRSGREEAAEDRADRPADVLQRLQERIRRGQLLVGDEIRDAGVDRRAEESIAEAGDGGERDDRARATCEREREEDSRPDEVGADHEVAPPQPIEQRPQGQPDGDGREVGDDEDGSDPEGQEFLVLVL